MQLLFGGLLNRYEGSHYKDLLWAEKAPFVYGNRYSYEGLNTKEEAAGYGKLTWQFALNGACLPMYNSVT